MNPITLGMDGLLAGLLLIAVFVGLRLNGRLKALRESHAGFAKAVSELDAAAAKADSALKALHMASEQAHDDLLARIDTARSLILRMEKAGEGAERSAQRAEAAATIRPLEPAPSAAPRRPLSDLLAAYETRVPPAAAAPEPPLKPFAPVRRRPAIDEDLFAEADALAAPALAAPATAGAPRSSLRGRIG
jgi:hypothetical protein